MSGTRREERKGQSCAELEFGERPGLALAGVGEGDCSFVVFPIPQMMLTGFRVHSLPNLIWWFRAGCLPLSSLLLLDDILEVCYLSPHPHPHPEELGQCAANAQLVNGFGGVPCDLLVLWTFAEVQRGQLSRAVVPVLFW